MLKTLLVLTTAAGLAFAADNTIPAVTELDVKDGVVPSTTMLPFIDTTAPGDGVLAFRDVENYTVNLTKLATNVIWQVDDSTNRLDMATFTQVDTNWFTIEKGTNVPPAKKAGEIGLKEIGEIRTNRYLTIVYIGQTNKFLMGIVGKEEFPSQKRYRLDIKPPGQPQSQRQERR